MQVWALTQEDPLEKDMAAHSSIFAWKIPQAEEPGRLHSKELQSRTWVSDWALIGAKTQSRYDSNNLFLILSLHM